MRLFVYMSSQNNFNYGLQKQLAFKLIASEMSAAEKMFAVTSFVTKEEKVL